jgi:tetratricopeptide (TPR) repeat protein
LSEIQRSDARPGNDVSDVSDRRDTAAASAADRDAKIEQLLLAGLDSYFSAQYDQAINVWTRALFLDRNHPRARAYIDRARSALAEKQRQSEELLHDGVAAYQRGESDEARRLLHAAIDGGAPADEALAILERLERPSLPGAAAVENLAAPVRPPVRDRAKASVVPPRFARSSLIVLAVAAAGLGVYVVRANRLDWRTLVPLPWADPSPSPAAAPIAQETSLPLPRRGEMALASARALALAGRLHEALAALDAVRPTDPQKIEADRLKADLQRQLLALTPMPPPTSFDRRLP